MTSTFNDVFIWYHLITGYEWSVELWWRCIRIWRLGVKATDGKTLLYPQKPDPSICELQLWFLHLWCFVCFQLCLCTFMSFCMFEMPGWEINFPFGDNKGTELNWTEQNEAGREFKRLWTWQSFSETIDIQRIIWKEQTIHWAADVWMKLSFWCQRENQDWFKMINKTIWWLRPQIHSQIMVPYFNKELLLLQINRSHVSVEQLRDGIMSPKNNPPIGGFFTNNLEQGKSVNAWICEYWFAKYASAHCANPVWQRRENYYII